MWAENKREELRIAMNIRGNTEMREKRKGKFDKVSRARAFAKQMQIFGHTCKLYSTNIEVSLIAQD